MVEHLHRANAAAPRFSSHPAATVLLLAAAVAGTMLFAPAGAAAQAGPGTVRVGAGFRALNIQLAPGVQDTLRVDTGLDRIIPGFEFGRQFGHSVFFGSRVALALRDLGGDAETFGLTAVPRIELLLGSQDRVIPMIGAQMGVSLLTRDGDTDVEFVAGGMLGMHIFTAPSFVVSPVLEVNYLRDPDFDNDLLQISLAISFSGWFYPS